jgi:hypothetical protein
MHLMEEQKNNQQPQVEQPNLQYQSGQLEQPIAPTAEQTLEETVSDGKPLVSWAAPEFVSHEKSAKWYIVLALVAAIFAGVMFVFTREIFSVIVVAVLTVAVGVFGNIKPRDLDYAIFGDGIQVGEKHFSYATFKSFAVIDGEQAPSIQLLPQKRLMVPITIYFAPADTDIIVETLGDFLPFEHKERDFVDKISSRIRF